mmetsp:Transcript_108404/g.171036  ORF Transcript_108404/g.171036 Transcript_108404/m.171036 type:complete len:145 (-) Transcript_108404:116-550(-)|eukprot:CAMPEP_0169107110 /NCGR_PEP_ID=MMETSP1015-20121227/24705_1 /TAXON_ID=342587 /ORGANISM="Karlodinium micrum, Strain CCMP2283" /LENGTH=144 /DNA_ID=CAMNT_0009168615 /DNA_START=52 /DNA_END=486 /DNA_ORIENTATION=-
MVKGLEEKDVKLRTKKAEKAQKKAEQAERQLAEKLENYSKKVDVGSLASAKGLSKLEAAHVYLKANAGDVESQRAVFQARCARKLEARIKQTASRGNLSVEEARALHEQANDGDDAAKEKIRQIRQTSRAEAKTSTEQGQEEST